MSYEKGRRAENNLANQFYAEGWQVIRSAGSGTAPRPNPDLLAMRDGTFVFVECKTAQSETQAVDVADEKQQMEAIARTIGPELTHDNSDMTLKFVLSITVNGRGTPRMVPMRGPCPKQYSAGVLPYKLVMDCETDLEFAL